MQARDSRSRTLYSKATWVCCSLLQSVAVYCSLLQSFAVCCNLLQSVAVCCSLLQSVAVGWLMQAHDQWRAIGHVPSIPRQYNLNTRWDYDDATIASSLCCSALQHCVAVCCSVLQCVAVCCSVLQCVAVYCRWQDQAIFSTLWLVAGCGTGVHLRNVPHYRQVRYPASPSADMEMWQAPCLSIWKYGHFGETQKLKSHAYHCRSATVDSQRTSKQCLDSTHHSIYL